MRHSQRKRRDPARLNLRSMAPVLDPTAAAAGGASGGLQSAAQCLIKGGQQERQDGCPQAGGFVAHGQCCGRSTTEKMGCGRCASWPVVIRRSAKDLTRVMNRLKALYRGWGIPCAGTQVYAPRYREEWLGKIRASRGAPASRAALSTAGWIAGLAAKRSVPSFWRRAGNIKPRNCCARFPASVRFGRRD